MKQIRIDYDRLRYATFRHGTELAAKLGIHQTSFSRKVTGKIGITLDEINQIAVYLGMDADRFIEIYTEADEEGR